MNKRITALAFAAALAGAGINGWSAENATGNDNNPVTHPINAYNNHEVKEDMKDSQVNSQKASESKKLYEEAKANYEKSLKGNGAESEVTKAAKSRMDDARKDMKKFNKKTAEANSDLKKHEKKAQQ